MGLSIRNGGPDEVSGIMGARGPTLMYSAFATIFGIDVLSMRTFVLATALSSVEMIEPKTPVGVGAWGARDLDAAESAASSKASPRINDGRNMVSTPVRVDCARGHGSHSSRRASAPS